MQGAQVLHEGRRLLPQRRRRCPLFLSKGKDLKSKPDIKDSALTDEYEFENPKKVTPAKEPEIDPTKLKEMKREEEILKAKQVLERKKLVDKVAAKAAIREQKEAEKKLKDREKKAKKKASGVARVVANPEDDPKDEVTETTEVEKVDDDIQAPKEKV